MPVDRIFSEAVEWGQVKAAAKPPHRRFAFFSRNKEAHVGMRSGRVGVMRMDNERDAHRLEAAPR